MLKILCSQVGIRHTNFMLYLSYNFNFIFLHKLVHRFLCNFSFKLPYLNCIIIKSNCSLPKITCLCISFIFFMKYKGDKLLRCSIFLSDLTVV
uniref:Ovule protein n=1 Tax=Heterorhabditis bacteriophora TaxID=37862 RepID=A0A1I7W8F6_HETBA